MDVLSGHHPDGKLFSVHYFLDESVKFMVYSTPLPPQAGAVCLFDAGDILSHTLSDQPVRAADIVR